MSNTDSSQNFSNESEFDFGEYYSFLNRNYKIISLLTGLTFLISTIVSFTIKKTWEGQFQIVVVDSKSNTKSLIPGVANRNIRDFLKPTNTNLKTQIEILKSPSVLMPIFNKLKNQKIKSGNDKAKSWIFNEWRDKNLNIQLIDGTNILDLKFRDKEKSLILPILDEISLTYQKYAINKDSKKLEDSKTYFENQIIKFKEINENDQRNLDKFILDNNLVGIKTIEGSKSQVFNEMMLIDAEIKIIDNKNFISKNPYNYDQKTYPLLIKEIEDLDRQISSRKLLFKENDKSINFLLKKREMLLKSLDNSRYSYLVNRKKYLTKIFETSIWDEDTIIKFKELQRQAKKSEITLKDLEKVKLNLELERAKTSEPWELITKPTLLDYPVAPSKKLIVGMSTIIGILISSLIVKSKEKKEDLIYSYEEIEFIMDKPILYKFELNQKESWDEIFTIFSRKIIKELYNLKIAFVPIGSIKKEKSTEFITNLNSNLPEDFVIRESNLLESNNYDVLICLIELANTKKEDLKIFKNKIDLQSSKIFALFVIG